MEIVSFLLVLFRVLAQLTFLYLLLEKLWPLVLHAKIYLAPYFNSVEPSLKERYGAWAVVTGCTDGFGKSYAYELAKRGLNVVLISRNLTKLMDTAREIEKKFDVKTKVIVADFSICDLTLSKHIENELEQIPIGILINNVGINSEYPAYLHELSEETILKIISVNVGAATLMTRLVLPIMLKNNAGAIVNVSSGSELQPLPLMTVYAATKAYIKSFSAAIRLEYGHKNITVQNLAPFFANTKINAFSEHLQKSSVIVPDADTYVRHAIATIGHLDHTAGYWCHCLQYFFTTLSPERVRSIIGYRMNRNFRAEYLTQHKLSKD